MNVAYTQKMNPKRLATAYTLTSAGFACISILALALSRLEHLFPTDRVLSATTFGQLLGLHEVLLKYFVLLPALPAAVAFYLLPGRLQIKQFAFPRLSVATFALFVTGGMLVTSSSFFGGIEPGWMYVTDQMVSGQRLSPIFLLGMILGCVSLQLLGVNLAATILPRRTICSDVFTHSLYWASWLLILAMPMMLGALVMAYLNSHTALSLFHPALGGDPTLLVALTALLATPLQMAVLLPILGLACDVLGVEARLPTSSVRWVKTSMVILAVLSLVVIDPQAMPDVLAPSFRMALSFNKLLLVLPLCFVLLTAFRAGLHPSNLSDVPGVYVLGALLFLGLRVPLSMLLLMPSSGLYTQSYLNIAEGTLLIAGSLFMVVLALSYQTTRIQHGSAAIGRLAHLFAFIILAGMMATTLPMLLAGASGLPVFMAVFPKNNLFFQLLILSGSGVLLVGLLGAGGQLMRARRTTLTSKIQPA